MARQRIVLDEEVNVTTGGAQDPKFAVRVGSAKSGFAAFVFNASATGPTVSIETSPFANLNASTAAGLWTSAGSASSPASAPALLVVGLSNLMDVLRWRVTGSGALRFSVVLYLYDT